MNQEDSTDLIALAERCENLEPDWGEITRLNADIHSIAPDPKTIIPPDYCRSLDAAMSLVPEGSVWDVTSTGTAWVMPDGILPQVYGKAATPALALCAAAIRAIASHKEKSRG